MKIRIAGYVKESIVDGPGIRFTIFSQGCYFNCKGCHNPQTHDITAGREIEIDELIELLILSPLSRGLTITGGEPFLQLDALLELIIKAKPYVNNIIVYTGYTYEELINLSINNKIYLEILTRIDYLIDGKFLIEEKDLTLQFRGSRNQRIIDMSKSSKNHIVIKSF